MTVRSIHRRSAGGALALALPLALFGCAAGGDGGDDGVDVAVGAGPAQARVAGQVIAERLEPGLLLPLDAYAFTDAESRLIGAATEAAVKECFVANGRAAGDADPLPFTAGAREVTDRHERRYAVADADVAARYGYHPPPARDLHREFYEGHSADELALLTGTPSTGAADGARSEAATVPDGGCLGQADAVLAPADGAAQRAGEELVSTVQSDAWHGALRDPRVLDVFAAWSACMADAGFDYEAPMRANDDPAWWVADTAGPQEIATATADVACKDRTGLIATWSAVEAEYQAELIAEHQAGLDAYRAVLDRQVAQARTALPE